MIVDIIPQKLSQVSPSWYQVRLDASLNAGYYDFTATTVPLLLFNAPGGSLFLFSSYSITSDAPEAAYLAGINGLSGGSALLVSVLWSGVAQGSNSNFPTFPVNGFFEQRQTRIWFPTPSSDASPVLVQVTGQVGQGGFAVPPAQISLFIQFEVYCIRSTHFIETQNTKGIGETIL